MTNLEIAEAFSRHDFGRVADRIADDVVWNMVGGTPLVGRAEVIAACEATAAENSDVETVWLRFVSTSDGPVVAVDAVGRYVGADEEVVVSSCDIYEFDGGMLRLITSYAAEVEDPAV